MSIVVNEYFLPLCVCVIEIDVVLKLCFVSRNIFLNLAALALAFALTLALAFALTLAFALALTLALAFGLTGLYNLGFAVSVSLRVGDGPDLIVIAVCVELYCYSCLFVKCYFAVVLAVLSTIFIFLIHAPAV